MLIINNTQDGNDPSLHGAYTTHENATDIETNS